MGFNVPTCAECGEYILYEYGVRSCPRCGPIGPFNIPLAWYEKWADDLCGLGLVELDEDLGFSWEEVDILLDGLPRLHGWQFVIDPNHGPVVYPPSWELDSEEVIS